MTPLWRLESVVPRPVDVLTHLEPDHKVNDVINVTMETSVTCSLGDSLDTRDQTRRSLPAPAPLWPAHHPMSAPCITSSALTSLYWSYYHWSHTPHVGGGGLPGGQQRCAVLVRASNVGELTPAGQEAVRCAQATLLYPKCPQSIWYMETGVPNTVHGTGDSADG